ncbi:MAG: hypothetical protein J6U53_05880 [Tidjanibacter sp.]|nr:hypothetical protein [Tidjanibacter sp.]
MKQVKRYTLTLLLLCIAGATFAQEGSILVGVRGGYNETFGNFSAISLEAQHTFSEHFALEGGFQQNTYERFVAEVRPSYHHKLEFGDLQVEALAHYTTLQSIQTCALGIGVGLTTSHLFATVGYYFRTLQGSSTLLTEPFNLLYEFGVSCLPKLDDWALKIALTNCRNFDLDRHYQPSLYIDGWWYPSEKIGVMLGASYKPTGVFHISSTFYQFYANFGVCYRW